jgi:hypothetical protein
MTVPTRITWTSIGLRLLIVCAISLLLGLFLFGIQVAIERKEIAGWQKFLFFVLLVYGSGLSWDIVKKIATLPETRHRPFSKYLLSAFSWLFAYWVLGIIFMALIGPFASIATILSGFIFVGALLAGGRALWQLNSALEVFAGASSPQTGASAE